MLYHTTDPPNAEPELFELTDSFITPVERFFKRNHAPAPTVDAASFRLVVDGLVDTPMSLSLAEIADLPRVELAATLQCAGNRRQDLIDLAPTPGEVPWRDAAIGNAEWSGWRLAELLARAGVNRAARHVAFLGLDRDGKAKEGFGASIPVEKAMSPEVLLADIMNGEPLLPEHGFPLRVVVPGFIGARSVKWLHRITVQIEESENHYQRRAYKLFPPDEGGSTADWDACASIEDYPVSAVITRPAFDAAVPAGKLRVVGYVITGGGRHIESVEVSPDGGRTWVPATIAPDGNVWTWRFWEAEVDLGPGEHVLAARATDEAGGQPADVTSTWNFKGYLNNAWHRVRVVAG